MTPTHRLLQAAKRSEIGNLERLAATCELVGDISRFVHALQKERGASNIYLTSRGQRFSARRLERVSDSLKREQAIRERLDDLPQQAASNARLLKRIACVWAALDALPTLRREIESLAISADAATRTYNRLIGGLLAVVFDAADTADDPDVTHSLVAIFHFMQGKELAGQERACGAIGFTAGEFDAAHRQLLLQLIDAQQRCFDTFCEFASDAAREHWQQQHAPRRQDGIQQLRKQACSDHAAQLNHALGETWYELTTARIDAMQQVEAQLTAELSQLCHRKIEQAQADINDQQQLDASLHDAIEQCSTCEQLVDLFPQEATHELGQLTANAVESRLNRALIDLMQSQNARLQHISDELENTREMLRERKLIERAKGMIMEHQQMSEDQAYRFLRKASMDQSKSMAEMARTIIDLANILQKRQA
ncbi:response regulator receiver protein [Halomonas sp. 1513]|nr:nitrate- and nitrite sensing domain-containing protein [Halomonas sp. 1513]APX92228.1 response regulator receiver protein [Halomonas sp. 1513]